MDCPSDELYARYAEGELDSAEGYAVRGHVEKCIRCMASGRTPANEDDTMITDRPPVPLPAPYADGGKVPVGVGDIIREKYEITGVLGSGGMGTVLCATHMALQRTVALKVMHADSVRDPESLRRFYGEARVGAALESANAVRVLDVDRLEGTGLPFIVMEYLEGRDLRSIVDESGPIHWPWAVHYILQALDAVSEAHEQGIIHRDLKPQNLFLTRRGVVKVVDFGLAKTLSAMPSSSGAMNDQTETKVLLGSPHYMPPEQLRSARRADERTDIWALGATLYHLVSGAVPFSAPNLFLLGARIVNEAVPSLASAQMDLPASLDAVVQRCMRKTPAERYPSCAELRAALEDVLAEAHARVTRANTRGPHDPPETRPLSTLERPGSAGAGDSSSQLRRRT